MSAEAPAKYRKQLIWSRFQ